MLQYFRIVGLALLLLTGIGNTAAFCANQDDVFEGKYYPILFLKEDPSTFILVGDIDIRTSLNFKRAVLDVGVPEALLLNSNGGLVYFFMYYKMRDYVF